MLFFLVVFLSSGCISNNKRVFDSNSNNEDVLLMIKVDEIVAQMSLEERISQLFIITTNQSEYSGKLSQEINRYQPGGFIIFTHNIESADQITKMIDDMQKDSKLAMFIATDQEGGRVQRFSNVKGIELTVIPSMQEVGKRNDSDYAWNLGRTIGKELSIFGVNMNFAPCLDIGSNNRNTVVGDRSFGSNPEIVTNMALQIAKGMREEGIIPVYKHFPGHGGTIEDSHFKLAILNKDKEDLLTKELIPYIEVIKQDADVIMIGHISVPKLTMDNTPATLSPLITTKLLKEELGFEGVVISDALNMKGLRDNYNDEEILIQALNAGIDILLIPQDLKEAIDIIKKGIENNQINENRIDESVKKILLLKFKYRILKLADFQNKEE